MASSSPINVSTLFSLTGRIALITGGGTGIGSYIAHGYAQAGATRVYIAGRRTSALETIAAYRPGVIIPLEADIASKAGCAALAEAFETAERARGVEEPVLDVLINNAGISRGDGLWDPEGKVDINVVQGALLRASDEDWATTFAINTSSIQWLTAALLPLLARSGAQSIGRASVINNTSMCAHAPSQLHVYSASKAAAENLTTNLSHKLAPLGVRANSIAVGNVPSGMNDLNDPESFIVRERDVPLGRVGCEEDVVGAAVYLASRAGSFVTGACLKIDGGFYTVSSDERGMMSKIRGVN